MKDIKNSDQSSEILLNDLRFELLTYKVILLDQLNWEIKDQYLELLKKFVEKEIDIDEFRITFTKRYKSKNKVANFLE